MLLRFTKASFPRRRAKRRILNSMLAAVGYALSPLSWWNDLFVNVPLSYAFSYPFTLIDKSMFLPSFILGYWLSNLLGLILLHRGISGLLAKPSMNWRGSIMVAVLYTLVIALLVWLGWIPVPTEILQTQK